MPIHSAKSDDIQPAKRTLKGGVDPAEAGRRGGLARVQSTTPEQRSEIARNAQAARIAKHRKRLLNITGPAIEALYDITVDKNHPARASAAKAILDRSGFGPKSSIEIEGEISGELIHKTQCLDVAKFPLIVKRMMAACLETEWEPSEALEEAIRAELPMLQVKIDSSKPTAAKGSTARNNASHSIINRSITGAVVTTHQEDQEDQEDQG